MPGAGRRVRKRKILVKDYRFSLRLDLLYSIGTIANNYNAYLNIAEILNILPHTATKITS